MPTPDAAPEPDAEVIEAPDASRPPTAVDTEEPDEEAVLLGGGVLIFELASEFLDQAGAGARFTDAVSLIDPNAESYGPCVVTDSDPNAPPETPAWGYDAGVISVSGTSPEVVLSPVADTATGTGYESGLSESLETLLPATGALLTVSGAGGADIPAFVGYLQVPAPVNLSSPQTGLFEGVPASSDLTISWNAGGGDTALVTLTPMSQTFQALAGKGLVCTVEGDPGSMIVPKAALQVLKSSGVSKVALGVTRMQTSVTNAGGWGLPLVLTRSTGGPLGLD